MKQFYTPILLIIFVLSMTTKSFSQVGAIYNTSTTGTLSGTSFTLSGFNGSFIQNYDLSTSSYSSAPLSSSHPSIDYENNSNWSITFDTPIENLKLYCKFWRNTEVSFNHSFTILSGSTNLQNPSGNQLNTVQFANGVIEFSNPITTLSLTTISGGASGSHQVLTFGGNSALSIDDLDNKTNNIKVFPNPSTEFIQISGLSKEESYKIYNVLGVETNKGSISNNDKINIQNLTNGIYFLKFDSGNTIKFIKE